MPHFRAGSSTLAPLTEQGLVACTVLALISIHEGFLTLKSDLGLCD